MLNSAMEGVFRSTPAATLTEIVLWLLIGIFFSASVLARRDQARRFTAYTPTLLTSLGILGTFAGIVVGLMDFDPQNIDASIEALLGGMKTAFLSSLAGMGSSIAFKMLTATPLLAPKGIEEPSEGAGPDEIHGVLLNQQSELIALRTSVAGDEESSLAGQLKLLRSDLREQHQQTAKGMQMMGTHLGQLHSAVAGDEESSLAGQLKMLRADRNDQHRSILLAMEKQRRAFGEFADDLWARLNDFAEMLSKSATEQVIEALNQVIADFNRNLTEQFGENFKALDASVKKLVEWQDNYRQQLEQMSDQYTQGVKAITQTEASVAHISEESKAIPASMAELKVVIETNQHQLAELERHLEAFRDMKDRAVEAVPQIREQVQKTVDDVAASVDTASTHYRKLLEGSNAYIAAHDRQTTELLKRYAEATDKGVSQLQKGLEDSAVEVKKSILAGAEEFDANVVRMRANLTETSDTLANQSTAIREQLGDAVKDINHHVRDMTSSLDSESKGLAETLRKTGEKVQRDTQATQQQVADSIQQMQSRLEATLGEVFAAQTRAVDQAVTGMLKEMERMVSRTGDGVNAQLGQIDEAMQKELAQVMQAMGNALAQISGKFTADYQQLTDAMAQVIRANGRAA